MMGLHARRDRGSPDDLRLALCGAVVAASLGCNGTAPDGAVVAADDGGADVSAPDVSAADTAAVEDAGGSPDAPDEPPTFTAAQLALLATLSPPELPPPPADVSNAFADNPAAAHLGQELFFDPSFSGRLLDPDNDGQPGTLGTVGQTGRVACSSCHVPTSGFIDTRSPGGGTISLAAGWGIRRAPSLLDVGQDKLLTWIGRHDAFYNQVFGVIESPLEWNSARLYVAEQLARGYRSEYDAVFGGVFGPMPAFDDPAQFPQIPAQLAGCTPGPALLPTCNGTMHGMPGDGAEYDGLTPANQQAVTRAVVNMGKAIEAYLRELSCGSSRFDQWVHGDPTALDDAEQRGAAVFIGPGRCVTCHSGPYFSDQQFHDVSLTPVQVVFAAPGDLNDQGAIVGISQAIADPLNTHGPFSDGDDGRLPAAVTPAMQQAFKTPMLRCVSRRPAFMHTGQLSTLAQVVAFFNAGGDLAPPGTQGKNELQPLGLTAEEQADLVRFLEALDGPGPDAALLAAPSGRAPAVWPAHSPTYTFTSSGTGPVVAMAMRRRRRGPSIVPSITRSSAS
jgi:cytochrome c peroxidase